MNEYDSVQPVYENGPKEVNVKRGMPGGDNQFGKGSKMPQENKTMVHKKSIVKSHNRHKEYR